MTYTDLDELLERRPRPSGEDPLSLAVGSDTYARNHLLATAQHAVTGAMMRLRVARFYFLAAPKVAVDFKDKAGTPEDRATKRAWCRANGVRYEILDDQFDLSPFVTVVAPVAAVSLGPRERRSTGIQTPSRR
jgi:hypothetical protein